MSDSQIPTYWGYSVSIDAKNCSYDAITNPELIKEFLKDLVEKIGMVAFGPPQVVRFGEGVKSGITAIQLIETSCITIHFVDNDGTGAAAFYGDVFSCMPYDLEILKQCFRDYFGHTSERIVYAVRQA